MSRSLQLVSASLFLLSVIASHAPAADPGALPTSAELHKMFEDGQYQSLLAKLPRVLALKGAAAAKYDLVDLNLLKSETFVQLKQQAQAITASNDAVKAITGTSPPESASKARAQQILLKQSPGLTYTPKADRTQKPIPLADMAQRKTAYGALFADMQADVATKIKAAQNAKALPPILAAIQSLADMSAVEMAATGSDKATARAADDLAGGAKKLLTDGVNQMNANAAAIDKSAKEMIPFGVQDRQINTGERGPDGKAKQITITEATMRMRGLTSGNRRTLAEVSDTCDRVVTICASFERISKQHAGAFQQIQVAAQKTLSSAQDTLKADYTGTFTGTGRQGGTR